MENSFKLAEQARKSALEMVSRANASHIGGALSSADIFAVLYSGVLKADPANPLWPERDRFILSKGHCCVSLYAALAWRGFFPTAELESYGRDGSRLMCHVSHKVPGVEFSTGSLGHGLPFGCGRALAAKRKNATWRTFVLLSDGELDEGSNWEAILFAGHHRLNNLIAIIDYNKWQSLGSVAEVMELAPLAEKFLAFGWEVKEVDGHDHQALHGALITLPWSEKPSCLLAHTIKGKGIDFMENCLEWHYKAPNKDQLATAISQVSK